MTTAVSMLVPLQTLFGWPSAPDPSPLAELGLLAGLPLVVIIAFYAIAKIHAMMRIAKVGAGPQPSDPVWMGGRALSMMDGAEQENKAVADSQRQQLEATGSSADAETSTGGAGARW